MGAINYNPAGLGQLRDKEITALYAPQLQGMNLDYFAYALPTEMGSFGISYRTLTSGALDGRDDVGNQTSGFSAQDSAYAVSFGRAFFADDERPSGLCRLGANLKYITSRIGSYSASTYAADLGAQFPMKFGSVPVAAGAAMNNIGALYEGGDGVARNYAEAVRWYSKAVAAGEPIAMVDLGWQYAMGR